MDFWPQSTLSGRLLIIQFKRTVLKHFDLGTPLHWETYNSKSFCLCGLCLPILTVLENNKFIKYLLIYLIMKNPQYGNTDDIFV